MLSNKSSIENDWKGLSIYSHTAENITLIPHNIFPCTIWIAIFPNIFSATAIIFLITVFLIGSRDKLEGSKDRSDFSATHIFFFHCEILDSFTSWGFKKLFKLNNVKDVNITFWLNLPARQVSSETMKLKLKLATQKIYATCDKGTVSKKWSRAIVIKVGNNRKL